MSGDLNSKDNREYIVAGAVSVKRNRIGDVTRAIHNLKKNILNNETLEIKSTKFINKDTLNDPTKNKHIFIQSVFDQVLNTHDCKYCAVIIKNENVQKVFPKERLSKHYIYLLQRIQLIAQHERCNAIVVIDNNSRKVDKWSAYAFNNYLYRTSDGQRVNYPPPTLRLEVGASKVIAPNGTKFT
ncbi:hypothetical protein [Aneurinibacillus thermoaerophilus]|uniref:hypothetical protein n=1 Tax=Aneurinibacillus thermoaerophilus TaxID=143495 RepID=UPI00399C8A83